MIQTHHKCPLGNQTGYRDERIWGSKREILWAGTLKGVPNNASQTHELHQGKRQWVHGKTNRIPSTPPSTLTCSPLHHYSLRTLKRHTHNIEGGILSTQVATVEEEPVSSPGATSDVLWMLILLAMAHVNKSRGMENKDSAVPPVCHQVSARGQEMLLIPRSGSWRHLKE